MTEHDAQADLLVERLFGAMLGAFDVYSIYLGDRLGYYRALADGGPATAGELADRTEAIERYTREWLEQQAVAGLLEVDDGKKSAETRRYGLPPGRAEVLTDADSLRYLAAAVRQVSAAGAALPALVDTYLGKRTMSWQDYGRDMVEGQAAMNRPWYLASLGPKVLTSIAEVHDALAAGGRVADIGCGHGWSTIGMALVYSTIRADGFDLDLPSIEAANRNAMGRGVADRVRFFAKDAGDPELAGTYDLVTAFECIHDMARPVEVLRTMRRLAKDGGTVIVMDEKVGDMFSAPGDDVERFMYGFSITTCLPDGMSHEGSVGTGTVMRPGTFRGYAKEAGFTDIEILPIDTDFWRFYRLVG